MINSANIKLPSASSIQLISSQLTLSGGSSAAMLATSCEEWGS